MIDIHSHILFDIDDGAENIDTSVFLCKQAAENGIDKIVATPHFTDYRNIEEFVLERDSKLDVLREELIKENIDITLYAGAELYLSPAVMSAGDLDALTINNSRYMLCEFPLGPFNPKEGLEEIVELTNRGYVPILAHPERYFVIRRDAELIERLLHRDVIFQVNADSLAGNLDPLAQKIAVDLIKNGVAKFIGSDAHDIHRRNLDYRRKFSTLPDEISREELISCLSEYPQAVLDDEEIIL